MCCGATESAPAVGVFGEAETPDTDEQMYRVSYFNGTTEDVQGLDKVRRVLLTPAARAEGTDQEGFQGGSYSRI